MTRARIRAVMMRMEKRTRKAALVAMLVVAAATTAFIFANSLLGSEDSWKVSSAVGTFLGPILHRMHDLYASACSLVGVGNPLYYGAFVRKLAHFCEYCLLGAECAFVAMVVSGRIVSPCLWGGAFVPLAVAVIDEYTQSFVGRTSLVADVLLDFSGALVGIALVVVVALVVKRLRSRRECVKGT